MEPSLTRYVYLLIAALLLFFPATGVAADPNLDFTEEETRELERLEGLLKGGGSAPTPARDNAVDKAVDEEKAKAEAARMAEEKRKKAVAARIAEEKRKKAEAARIAEEKRKKVEAARMAEEKRKKAEAVRMAEEKRKKAEAARKARKEAAAKATDAADASSAARLKVLEAKIGILKLKQAAMERKLKETGAKAEPGKIEISGFVDISYFNDQNSDTSTFSLDQVEVDVEVKINDKASVRFDLQYVNLSDDSTTPADESDLSMDEIVEQGYIDVKVANTTLTFGKFNAPIGFELLDAPDMFQYSHAMVFDNGLPTNLTGAMAAYSQGMIDLNLYVVNGWDLITDDNTDITFGGRIGITPMKSLNIGLSAISGKENPKPDEHTLTVFDVDLTYTGVKNLTIGAEFNSGSFEKESAVDSGDAKWNGYLLMAHYDFAEWWGVTARYDAFNDEDGSRLGSGVKESRNSFTISPTFTIADGLGALIEYRHTKSNEDVFTDKDGNAKDTENTFAVEITYTY